MGCGCSSPLARCALAPRHRPPPLGGALQARQDRPPGNTPQHQVPGPPASSRETLASVIAIDVNETLLDLGVLDEPFEVLLGRALRPQWFTLMLQLAFTCSLTGQYVDFTTAQRAALAMLAEREGVPLGPSDIDGLVSGMSSLPPHPEVPGALAALARAQLRMVALPRPPDRCRVLPGKISVRGGACAIAQRRALGRALDGDLCAARECPARRTARSDGAARFIRDAVMA